MNRRKESTKSDVQRLSICIYIYIITISLYYIFFYYSNIYYMYFFIAICWKHCITSCYYLTKITVNNPRAGEFPIKTKANQANI